MKTPQQSYKKLDSALGVEVYLKREDLHAYGSHKGRSIPFMIEEYVKNENKRTFVISSSGNAARAAIKYVALHNRNNPTETLTLTVYIGNNIAPEKQKLLDIEKENDAHISIIQVDRPKQQAIQLENTGKAINLRQSTNDLALEGYYELGKELAQIPNLQAIFVPTSSGTTAQALGEVHVKNTHTHAQIHIVQTESCHPIAETFDMAFTETDTSLADAIVDNVAHRKGKVVEVIQKSHGSGWIVSNEEIKKAINLIEDTCGISISPNAALSVAGLTKALQHGSKFDGPIACLITGI